ncbi:MAG: NusA-like transcription termination signal-binding factor [Candidatus Undinarchaeales archaeon]
MTIKLDKETLRYIAALENESRGNVTVKDCIVKDEKIVYVIEKGQLGAAIGKKGANVKKLRANLGKQIQVREFSDDPVQFVKNMVSNLKGAEVRKEENGNKIVIEANNQTKGAVLGKKGKNLQMIKDLLKRHHNIEEVVVK